MDMERETMDTRAGKRHKPEGLSTDDDILPTSPILTISPLVINTLNTPQNLPNLNSPPNLSIDLPEPPAQDWRTPWFPRGQQVPITPVSVAAPKGNVLQKLVLQQGHKALEPITMTVQGAETEAKKKNLLNSQEKNGFTPLMTAASLPDNSGLHLCEFLIASGADMTVLDSDGFGALHWAAAVGNTGIVEALALRGADMQLRSTEGAGDTALHRATRLGKSASIETLLKAKADPWTRNNRCATPLQVAGAYVKRGKHGYAVDPDVRASAREVR